MSEDYEKGKEIGELIAEQRATNEMLGKYIDRQDKWNGIMESRMSIAEKWIQTTTGKVIILTALFGIVGSLCYIGVNWVISHFGK